MVMNVLPAGHICDPVRANANFAACCFRDFGLLFYFAMPQSAYWARRKLQRLDLHHARHRLNRAGDLRRDLETTRQLDLDLGALL